MIILNLISQSYTPFTF